jgi:hypothetical protein
MIHLAGNNFKIEGNWKKAISQLLKAYYENEENHRFGKECRLLTRKTSGKRDMIKDRVERIS